MRVDRCLLDSNVLLRIADDPSNEISQMASSSVQFLSRSHTLCYASQNVGECWNALTRPLNKNGFGLNPSEALVRIRLFDERFEFLTDPMDVHRTWLRLLSHYEVSGAQVHDAHLVATMIVHGVTRVLTFNDADFARYAEIEALHPAHVADAWFPT